jgi:hypothetical protein
MSLSRGRYWINPTIRPLIDGSTLPQFRQPQQPFTGGPANPRAPTANIETQVPTASTEVASDAGGPLIKKHTKLRWSRKSTAPVCLKLVVQLDQSSSPAADTEQAHIKDDHDNFSRSWSQSSGVPESGRPGGSGPTHSNTSTSVFEVKDATASAKLQSESSAPRIRRILFDSTLKHEHGPFVKTERSGTSHTSRNVVNLILQKHPTRAKELRKPMRSLDHSGSRNSIYEQTTRDRVDTPIDGSSSRIKTFTLSIDGDLHGFTEHHSPRAVKAASKALTMAQIKGNGKTSLQPATRKGGSLSLSAITKSESQHESPAPPAIREEYGGAARSVNRRQRGPARLVIRRRTYLPKPRIWKVDAGPLRSRWRDSWPRLLVRRHHGAMDRNGYLSPSIIYKEVTRRSSQNPAVALPRSAFTPHASSSTPPRSPLKRGVSQTRSRRRFGVRRRHSIARKHDAQSQFDIRKYPAWFVTRSRIRRLHSLARKLEVLRKYVTISAFRDCNTKDMD